MKLSILICSTYTRRNTFLPKILDQVYGQYEALSADKQEEVEILLLCDNKKMMLGDKRNRLVDLAQGEYYVFIDDDDRISLDYISTLIDATEHNPDVITFLASVSLNGGDPKPCRYSIDFNSDHNVISGGGELVQYNRLPNHICCVKTEIGKHVSFPNIKYGEDSAYSKLLKPHLSTEYFIDRVLYHYDFNADTTETQEHLRINRPIVREDVPPIVDVVILSDSKDESYRSMCQKTIDTCIKGANGLKVNVIVIEQTPGIFHDGAKTILVDHKFNYNAFANIGARHGSAPWVMIANNDLIFLDGWLHRLLAADHPVVSPHEPNDPRQVGLEGNETGYKNGRNFCGWCFMMKRDVWERIGGLDEEFDGWYADDATIQQVKAIGIQPMVVADSYVNHLGSRTLFQLSKEERDMLCWGKLERFNEKYGQQKFVDNPEFLLWKASQR